MGRHYLEHRFQDRRKNRRVKRERDGKWMTALAYDRLCDQDLYPTDESECLAKSLNGPKPHDLSATEWLAAANRAVHPFEASICRDGTTFKTALLEGLCDIGNSFTYTVHGPLPVRARRDSARIVGASTSVDEMSNIATPEAGGGDVVELNSHAEGGTGGTPVTETDRSASKTGSSSRASDNIGDLLTHLSLKPPAQGFGSLRYTLPYAEARLAQIERFQLQKNMAPPADLRKAIDTELTLLVEDLTQYKKLAEYHEEPMFIEPIFASDRPAFDMEERRSRVDRANADESRSVSSMSAEFEDFTRVPRPDTL